MFAASPFSLQKRNSVLIIIPALNEESAIVDVVYRARLSGLGDVLVIDDGSIDGTVVEAQRAGAMVLQVPFNLGIGGAVQAGFKFAAEGGYEFVVRIDGDGQHDIEQAIPLLRTVERGDVDVAIGSRFIPGHQTYRPPLSRALGIRWFAFAVSQITRQRVSDPTSGMQALNRKAFTAFAAHYPQDYPEVEARIWLHKFGLRAVELPVQMAPRRGGVSSITYVRAIYYMLKVTLAIIMATIGRPPPRYVKEV